MKQFPPCSLFLHLAFLAYSTRTLTVSSGLHSTTKSKCIANNRISFCIPLATQTRYIYGLEVGPLVGPLVGEDVGVTPPCFRQ